jgi:hypothetical protein
LSRQLKNQSLLAKAQACQKNDSPIGELKRIMVPVRVVHVHLAEAGQAGADPSEPESWKEKRQKMIQGGFVVEYEFGAGGYAYGNGGLAECREPACGGFREARDNEGIASFRGAAFNGMEAVIAHVGLSLQ